MIHELKILPHYFVSVIDGTKRFEIRKDDRAFEVGQYLHLREFCTEGYDDEDQTPHYTKRECLVRVIYKTDFKQKSGYLVLGISDPI